VTALRIATFNVLFGTQDRGPGSWPERLRLIERALEQARPDLLGLQEALPSRLDDVAAAVGDLALIPGPCRGAARWTAVSTALDGMLSLARSRHLPDPLEVARGRREIALSGEHQPIAYRRDLFRPVGSGAFWISATPERPGSMLPLAPTPFLVHWARLELVSEGGTILILNGHLGHAPWHHAVTATTIARQIETLAASRVAGEQDRWIVLLGDFNAVASSPLLRRLTSATGMGFVDGAALARERAGAPVTFHWGFGAKRLGLTLDYVLVRGPLRPSRTEVIDVHEGRLYPSDHHPLVVEFETQDTSR